MMAVDGRRLSDAAPIDTKRAEAESDRQRAITRRQQALLAAAGEVAPEARWYVLRVAPRCEKAVNNALEEARIGRWLPLWKRPQPRRGGRNGAPPPPAEVVIFPGYIFVRVLNRPQSWLALATIKGVLSVLGSGEHPVPVADGIILKLRDLAADPVAVQEVLAPTLKAGERVRVKDGPFASFPGTLTCLLDGGRASVEVDIFGRLTPVDLELARLSKSD